MMNCQLFKAHINDYDLKAEARAHLSGCANCLAQREAAVVSRLVGELARVEAPSDFDFHLRARLARAQKPSVTYGHWFRIPAGAALAGLLAAGLWLGRATNSAPAPIAATISNSASALAVASLPEMRIPPQLPDGPEHIAKGGGSRPRVATATNVPSGYNPNPTASPVKAPPSGATPNSGILSVKPPSSPLLSANGAISLPATQRRFKVELANGPGGKRTLYIDTLTFGRQGQARPAPAASPEPIVW